MSEKDFSAKVEQLKHFDHSLSALLAQKQSIQVELNEVNNAQEELKSAKGDVYKIISGMMIKSDSKKISAELSEKEKLLSMRISSLEKQEKITEEKMSKLQSEINSSLGKNNS